MKTSITSTPAYSYLRVSGKSQIDGDGFPRQREAIRAFAEHRGYAVRVEFIEEGISGTNESHDRKALPALLDRLRANPEVTTVLIEKADRLARDLIVSELILREFRDIGVSVIAVDTELDLSAADDDPTKKLMRQIISALAEWDKTSLCNKLRAARDRMRGEFGRCEGRKPYGKDEAERAILDRMKSMRGTLGHTPGHIARIFNEEGVLTRTPMRAGKKTRWHQGSVYRILREEDEREDREKKLKIHRAKFMGGRAPSEVPPTPLSGNRALDF